jgi:thiol-disulfide isomerase/thioredoxin
VALAAGCGAGAAAPSTATLPAAGHLVEPGSAAPYLVADRLRGQVAVLDFWASWCDDCKRTIPQVVRLHAAYGQEGLVIVGVDAGETVDVARRAAGELGIDYPIALDPELAFSDAVGATALPTLLVIDRTGAIVHRARHVDDETLAVIRSLLHTSER